MSDNKEKLKSLKINCVGNACYKRLPEIVLFVAFNFRTVESIIDRCYAVGKLDGNVSGNLFEEWKNQH